MRGEIEVEILKPEELGAEERATWRAFRAADPRLSSPYFDLRYSLAAGEVAPRARVAVLHRRGRILGFLPFQRRGGAVQPLGAPMTDYHGPIAAPGEPIDLAAVVERLGTRVFRFTGLVSSAAPAGAGVGAAQTLAADLSHGFEAWAAAREARHHRFFKGKRRTVRGLERDLGPVRLEWSTQDSGVIDYVLRLKRAQYLRTRRHDIFACGWTERLLRRLAETGEADFGLGFATLYAGDTLLAAEIGLRSGAVHHLWLPVYEQAYARYGPGMLMTLESLKALAADGVRRVDFGRADAGYKAYFADPGGLVYEGFLRAPGQGRGLTALGERALAAAPSPLDRLGALGGRVRRRLDVIAACETTALGWCMGAALALGLAGATPLGQLRGDFTRRAGDTRNYARAFTEETGRASSPA